MMQTFLFTFRGTVVEGDYYGRVLGFPTANLDKKNYSAGGSPIPSGVYAGIATTLHDNRVYKAGIVVGPIEKDGLPKIEAHLLDFSGDLYGKELELSLSVYLRPYRHFNGEDALKAQIKSDIEQVENLIDLHNYSVGVSGV